MALFNYKGMNSSGAEVKGSINADTLMVAKQKLKTTGIMLISIKEQKADAGSQKKDSISFGQSVSVEDLGLMTRQLATLAKAKIQIVEAFSALVDQTENPKLKIILAEIRQKVSEGKPLSESFGDYPKVFNNVYVNMVEAGEQSGTLEVVLLRLADFTEAQMQLKNKIKGALTYPLIMVVVGAIMFGIIFTFVIPKITKIFKSRRMEIPTPTKICMWLSDTTRDYWWLMIISVFAISIAFQKYIHTKKGEQRWHTFLLNMPVIKDLVVMINVSRFSSTLATLLNSGVPILVAMKIVRNLIANVHMQKAVEQSMINVKEGASLVTPLKDSKLFPPMVTHMISLGEKSGELEEMLNIIAKNYEDQVNSKLSGLTSVLEPIMMIVMGGAVGFIVFSVVVPMMELNSVK